MFVTPFKFNRNGNRNVASNRSGNLIPPANLSSGEIIIDNSVGGSCILNITQTISGTGILTIKSGKNLIVPGYRIRN